jgi:phenylpyruvate tautomerase PptA (4-oxalocrotonate tautomerase family)
MIFSKKEEQYINNLLSSEQQIIIETLEEIKYSGSSKLLPFLIELLHVTNNETVKKQAYKILSELKHSDSVPIIIEAIQNEKYIQKQEMLIRSCWENGLDFTHYISVFVELVVHGNYMIAFEAFTVIENLEGHISDEEAKKMLSILENGLSGALKERKVLIQDLIQFIPKLIMEQANKKKSQI